MKPTRMIPVELLAAFMNTGWPGDNWYLTDHAEFLWEQTFTVGDGAELYRPRRPGTMINLYDFEGRLRWQGHGRDPTRGAGMSLVALFERWYRQQHDAVVVAWVPREKLPAITHSLTEAGCLLLSEP
ncbi:MAG: hypothetical protein NZ483_07795 [Verrucomicrobiae bacterium]|nr:hypothetical protein [Verrucomicrobiae bacterium]MDW8344225.1 hypothetical protein [Verrucomicrobiae bacterium]